MAKDKKSKKTVDFIPEGESKPVKKERKDLPKNDISKHSKFDKFKGVN